MKALERALTVEAALSKARSNDQMGQHQYYDSAGNPSCTMGHAALVLGLDRDCMMSANRMFEAFGIAEENKHAFSNLMADVQNTNDRPGDTPYEDAAEMLVSGMKELGIDDD